MKKWVKSDRSVTFHSFTIFPCQNWHERSQFNLLHYMRSKLKFEPLLFSLASFSDYFADRTNFRMSNLQFHSISVWNDPFLLENPTWKLLSFYKKTFGNTYDITDLRQISHVINKSDKLRVKIFVFIKSWSCCEVLRHWLTWIAWISSWVLIILSN